jgi:hypothetical protein
MHVCASLVADKQALELVEPGKRALDDPALTPEPGAMLRIAARDHGLDASLAEQPTVRVVVVAAIGDHAFGSSARPSRLAGNRRHLLEQGDQLGDVVAVAARERPSEWKPAAVYEEMVLGAGTAPVDRARPRFGAPFFAWI